MVDVNTEIKINAPIDRVYAYASNPENAPEWYKNIKSAEWRTEKILKSSSKVAFTAHFLGKKLEYTYEFSEVIPNTKLVMRTAEGPFPMETTYTWEKIDDRITLMKLRNRGNPRGFSKIFAPLMAMMMRKENNKDLKRIKEIIESKN